MKNDYTYIIIFPTRDAYYDHKIIYPCLHIVDNGSISTNTLCGIDNIKWCETFFCVKTIYPYKDYICGRIGNDNIDLPVCKKCKEAIPSSLIAKLL